MTGQTLHPSKASASTFQMLAITDRISEQSATGNFAMELLLVDPRAPLEEGCLVVFIDRRFGAPHMSAWESAPAMDDRGRFRKGPRAHRLGGMYTESDDPELFIVGRVVGPPRDARGERA